MKPHYLDKIFHPDSIAVIGASTRPNSVGKKIFSNLLQNGFQGKIYPVNPKHKEIQGHACYPNLSAIHEPMDLAIIATPATNVPKILKECGEQKIHHAIIISSGFSETGTNGKHLEAELLAIAKRFRIHFLGPNCLGVMRPSIGLNATFDNNTALSGNLALVSQSGALIAAIIDWSIEKKIGFSTIASLGNASDIDFGDVLDYLALDDQTHSILLYVEGIHDARRFMSGLRVAARMKPVIIIKGGRHAQGTRAALSHTGALVGADDAFDAAVRQAGAVRVITIDQLFAAAEILSSNYRTAGNRLTIITNGGGAGVLATDRAGDVNIVTPKLSAETFDKLNAILPSNWSQHNPVDILGDATPERYHQVITTCLQDESIDGILTILVPVSTAHPIKSAEELIAAVAEKPHKPVLACWMGEQQVKSSWELFAKKNLPCFSTPELAVDAFSYLANYQLNQQLLLQVPEHCAEECQVDLATANKIISDALKKKQKVLTAFESKKILKAFNIPVSESIEATNVDEAIKAAQAIRYPVVMKINSPDITHKLDVGGVLLNIPDEVALKAAFEKMMTHVKQSQPKAKILGVTIERMLKNPYDRELMAGIIHDAVFGPVIAFGAGGTLVEILQDSAVALPPLNSFIIKQLIARTRISKLLGEYRGMAAVNIELIENVMMSISKMVCELPQIQAMDINPLIINDKEIIAVDARIIIAEVPDDTQDFSHMAICPYPSDLTSQWQFKDGTQALIRPIRPEDVALEKQFMKKLSQQTRFMRFMESIQELTPNMLQRFTQIDYDREMALIALVENEIAAVARYTTNPDQESCEFAIVVADCWQKKGLGKYLLTRLMEIAKSKGLKSIQGEVLADNAHMLALMNYLDFKIENIPEEPRVKTAILFFPFL